MGTRHLTFVVIDEEIKVAQYGQWDGDPECTGNDIRDFLQLSDLEEFANKVRALKVVNAERVKKAWDECSEKRLAFGEKYPWFSRDTGADILPLILYDKCKEVFHNTDFASEGLSCEWGYVIDLDNKVLEVYKGFSKEPHDKGRFANMDILDKKFVDDKYYPIKLICEIAFKDLPDTVEEFSKMIKETVNA